MSGMRSRKRFVAAAIAAGALALAVASLAMSSTRVGSASSNPARVTPSPAELATVHDRVEQWLGSAGFSGFRVSVVMAFTNNDYAAVNGKDGKPAFELIVAPNKSWLMEELASMMWNTRYGLLADTSGTPRINSVWGMIGGANMMGSAWGMLGGTGTKGGSTAWYGNGSGKVTSLKRAIAVADKWLAKARPGESAEKDGRFFPGYFTMDLTRSGKTAGMLSVNASTGAVWYHGWHGTFLSERKF
jgi:hypothetical protein